MKKILLLSFCFLSFLGFSSSSPSDGEALKKHLDSLFETSKKVNLPSPEKEKARAQIEEAIDWDGIATLCLGEKNSKKYQGKNFSDFRNLLKEVISKTAFSRMDKFWEKGTTAQIDKVEVQGNKAHAGAKFNSQSDTFSLDYYFVRMGSRWVIQDVAFEDMKYSINIKEQIDAFLKEKPFSELLSKLRKRRDELDKSVKPKDA